MSESKSATPAIRFDFVKYQWLWYLISVLLVLPGLVFMGLSMTHYESHSPLRLGIDFTGGTLLDYGFESKLSQDDLPKIRTLLETMGMGDSVVQLENPTQGMKVEGPEVSTELAPDPKTEEPATPQAGQPPAKDNRSVTQVFEDMTQAQTKAEAAENKSVTVNSLVTIRTKDMSTEQTVTLQKALKEQFGEFALLQKNRVGPVLAQEILVKGGLALLLAYALIVIYLTWRFQMDYAVFAMTALVHDTIFLIGTFSMLGWLFNIEINAMFVTAILTVVGFSVHDTIVVYDRIRENIKLLYTQKLPIKDIVNISLNQTMTRSINTSMTALLVLTALYLWGGQSTQTFVLAMLLGIATGTYSSIFIASCMLAWWRSRNTESPALSGSAPKAVAI